MSVPEKLVMSSLISERDKAYLDFAALRLGRKKYEIICQSLGLHRDYLVRAGVVTVEEASRYLKDSQS